MANLKPSVWVSMCFVVLVVACGAPGPTGRDGGSAGGTAGGSAGGAAGGSAGGAAGGSAGGAAGGSAGGTAGGSAGGAAGGSAGGAAGGSAGGTAGGSAGGTAGGSAGGAAGGNAGGTAGGSAGGAAGGSAGGSTGGGIAPIDAGVFLDGGVITPGDSVLSLSLRGNSGLVYRFVCPALGLATPQPTVWGTNVYTDDSPICWAGMHAGRITRAQGGDVFVEVQPGLSSYVGSFRNGVTTQNYGSYSGSYAVLGAPTTTSAPWDGGSLWNGLPPVSQGLIDWNDSATSVSGVIGVRFAYTCPPLAGSSPGTIWGTQLYTADSAICAAGVHAGAVSNDGGVVTIEVLPGTSSYVGSTQNGLTSSSFGSYSSSYLVVP
ncbi:MAG: LCCL domain-containing protein [Myxococcaceae bacterium]|nr:LCCL domain-containing protein [Myxococcaceae bacterium]